MRIDDAQRDIRQAFLGGFVGQLVSAVLWLVSAALGTWGDHRYAIGVLVFGGVGSSRSPFWDADCLAGLL